MHLVYRSYIDIIVIQYTHSTKHMHGSSVAISFAMISLYVDDTVSVIVSLSLCVH